MIDSVGVLTSRNRRDRFALCLDSKQPAPRQEISISLGLSGNSNVPKLLDQVYRHRRDEEFDERPTVSAFTRSCTSQRIYPSALRDPEFLRVLNRGQHASSSQIDSIEGVHQERVSIQSVILPSYSVKYSQGKQIMRFFFVTVPIDTSVSAGLP